MTVGCASIVVSVVMATLPSASSPLPAEAEPLVVELEPMNDPELQRIAEFLAPRLELLAEGPGERGLRLRLERRAADRAVFRLFADERLLSEREQVARDGEFDGLELWLAMKNAWARARELDPAESRRAHRAIRVTRADSETKQTKKNTRPVTLAASTVLQGDGLSAFGAALGVGRGEGAWGLSGELAYARAPVDDALTVHHLFVQGHWGVAPIEGLAVEATGRLTAQFAVAGPRSSASFDLGVGLSGHARLGVSPELWLRASVLGHPVTQRYLFDAGERRSSALTFNLSAGVGL